VAQSGRRTAPLLLLVTCALGVGAGCKKDKESLVLAELMLATPGTYPLGMSPAPVGGAISFAGGDNVNDIAFSPNGMYLASGGAFTTTLLAIYGVSSHGLVTSVKPAGDIMSIAFAPSGAAIIAGEDAGGVVIVCN
jgi:WD40 repeat protein